MTPLLDDADDDIPEAFLRNVFHGERLASMPPRLLNEDRDLHVARPWALVAEADCQTFTCAITDVQPTHLAGAALFDFVGLAAALADADNSLQLLAER